MGAYLWRFSQVFRVQCRRMSFYRDTYLKSDDWRNLRSAAIAAFAPDGCCCMCRRACKPDVHHQKYRGLFRTLPWDLRVVCRECHDAIHALLKAYPLLKTLGRWRQWKLLGARLHPELFPDPRLRETWEAVDAGQFQFTKGFLFYNGKAIRDLTKQAKIETRILKNRLDANLSAV